MGRDHREPDGADEAADRPRGSPFHRSDDLRRLLATCDGKKLEDLRDKAVLLLFIDSGMRLSELANLRVEDIDLDVRVAMVIREGSTAAGLPVRSEDIARPRQVPAAGDPRSEKATGTDALWVGVRGPLGIAGVRFLIDRRTKLAGLEHIHAHQLRHTFAHRWLADGKNEGDLMRLAGRRSRTMLNRYAGASAADERARDAYDNSPSPADRL